MANVEVDVQIGSVKAMRFEGRLMANLAAHHLSAAQRMAAEVGRLTW